MDREHVVYECPISAEIKQRRVHIESLKGALIERDLESMNTAIRILTGNSKDLVDLTSTFIGTKIMVSDLSEDFSYEFSRRFYNFLAAAKSLMEVQRTIGNRWWERESEFMRVEQKEKVNELFIGRERDFLFKLRDYALHVRFPEFSLKTSFKFTNTSERQMGKQENIVLLKKTPLLEWKGWNEQAKIFLDDQNDEFDIFGVIERYSSSVVNYHKWFWNAVEKEFDLYVQEYKSKVRELAYWVDEFDGMPDWVKRGEQAPPEDWNPRRFRAEKAIERYKYGSRGYTTITVDSDGTAELEEPSSWKPLPRKIDWSRG